MSMSSKNKPQVENFLSSNDCSQSSLTTQKVFCVFILFVDGHRSTLLSSDPILTLEYSQTLMPQLFFFSNILLATLSLLLAIVVLELQWCVWSISIRWSTWLVSQNHLERSREKQFGRGQVLVKNLSGDWKHLSFSQANVDQSDWQMDSSTPFLTFWGAHTIRWCHESWVSLSDLLTSQIKTSPESHLLFLLVLNTEEATRRRRRSGVVREHLLTSFCMIVFICLSLSKHSRTSTSFSSFANIVYVNAWLDNTAA